MAYYARVAKQACIPLGDTERIHISTGSKIFGPYETQDARIEEMKRHGLQGWIPIECNLPPGRVKTIKHIVVRLRGEAHADYELLERVRSEARGYILRTADECWIDYTAVVGMKGNVVMNTEGCRKTKSPSFSFEVLGPSASLDNMTFPDILSPLYEA
jgi:hypothetical protein